jgi:hypothetical protein
MAIVPETKDWTWVLTKACPDCGFDPASVEDAGIGERLRANVATWRPLLAHPSARTRPDDSTWSATEYACHVRDVYRLFATRLQLMLDEDAPTFANWDQDETAVAERYDLQDPADVVDDLEPLGERLAAAFDAVRGGQWSRTGTRSDGARFTVASFGRYLLHDPEHHVWDVRQGYSRLDA